MNSTETKTELPITNNGSESEPLSLSTITMSKLSMENNTLRSRLEAVEKELEKEVYYGRCKDDTASVFMNQVKKLQAELANIENLEWRYSHDEIEASCGGKIALEVRSKVLKRRESIRKATAETLK